MSFFDNDLVTELIITWQLYGDKETYDEIVSLSTPLIEVVASSYGAEYRDDLIQEAYIQLQYALAGYNEELGSAFSFISAVVRNCCVSFLRNENKHNHVELPMIEHVEVADISHILEELLIRNRTRFPNIDADTIDSATNLIFMYVTADNTSPRGVVKKLMVDLNLGRSVATLLYHSSLAWLRFKYKSYAVECENANHAMTLLPDLQDYIGADAYKRILIVFSGMNLKIP